MKHFNYFFIFISKKRPSSVSSEYPAVPNPFVRLNFSCPNCCCRMMVSVSGEDVGQQIVSCIKFNFSYLCVMSKYIIRVLKSYIQLSQVNYALTVFTYTVTLPLKIEFSLTKPWEEIKKKYIHTSYTNNTHQ